MTPRGSTGVARLGRGAALLLLVWLLACRGGDAVLAQGSVPSAPATHSARLDARLAPVQLHGVCASLGSPRASAEGLFLVADPKLRATLAGSRGHGAEITFRYLGPSAASAPLRSGDERQQLGLELAARDTCNLLYVMWRIEPVSELVVSVKRNGALSTHAECENRGYHRLRPTAAAPVPVLAPGARHQLRAEIEGGALSVLVDGSLVWSGALDGAALELDGRSGLRSDNARFEVLALNADVRDGTARCSTERTPER